MRLNIYSLLDIKPDSKKIWFLFLPPIYALWILAIGKRILEKENKSNTIFSISTISLFILFALQIIALPFIDFDFIKTYDYIVHPYLILGNLCFFTSIALAASITVKFDRNKNTDRYYSIIDIGDYVKRFFTLVYCPFTIWSFQGLVNQYNREENNDSLVLDKTKG